jgi:hypothetical protein
MQGSESSRPAANYKADRALFLLLLSAPYRSIRLSNPECTAPAARAGTSEPDCPRRVGLAGNLGHGLRRSVLQKAPLKGALIFDVCRTNRAGNRTKPR